MSRPDLAAYSATTAPPISATATNLMVVLCAAELRSLPMPFSVRAYDTGTIELQFHMRAEVHTWAASLEAAEVVDDSHAHTDGINDVTTAKVAWFDVPLTLCASVPREPK